MRFKISSVAGLAAVFILAGCSKQLPATSATSTSTSTQTSPASTTSSSSIDASPPAKVGQTTKTGQITQIAGKLYLEESGQPPLEIDSYNVTLTDYVGKTVTVTGEYSGNTLFVGEIK